MTYAATLGMAKSIDLVVATLVAIPAVTTFCGGVAPGQRIVIGDGGYEPGQVSAYDRVKRDWAPPAIVVSFALGEDSMPGLGAWRENASINVDLYHAKNAADAPPDAYLRAIDELEGILDGIRTAGRTGALLSKSLRVISFPSLAIADCEPAWRGSWHSLFQLSYMKGIAP